MATPAILATVEQKRCAHCHHDLPITDFYQRGDGVPSSWCRTCQRENTRQNHNREDPEKRASRAALEKQERRELREATKNQRLMPFAEIGRRLGVSPQGALNIYRSAMEKLRAGASVEARSLYAESTRLRDARQTWGDLFEEESSS